MTVNIVVNANKDGGLAFSKQIQALLEAKGVTVVTANDAKDADFWIVLGGDGTMLRAARQAAIFDVPLLGINLGTMGFLTDVDKQDGVAAIEYVLAGRYESQKRLMLTATVKSVGCRSDVLPGDSQYSNDLALNEVYLGNNGKLGNYSVFINGVHMDDIRADGIIVATPTGSTAYNLSAGGPILAPYGQMMVITAICPHSLSTRPWVVEADDVINVIPVGEASLLLDGESRAKLLPGQGVEIRRAAVSATIIKTSSGHFYEILRKKKII